MHGNIFKVLNVYKINLSLTNNRLVSSWHLHSHDCCYLVTIIKQTKHLFTSLPNNDSKYTKGDQ